MKLSSITKVALALLAIGAIVAVVLLAKDEDSADVATQDPGQASLGDGSVELDAVGSDLSSSTGDETPEAAEGDGAPEERTTVVYPEPTPPPRPRSEQYEERNRLRQEMFGDRVPGECEFHCDCPQGWRCESPAGRCGLSPIPVYCCANDGCPEGETCYREDGTTDVCR